MEATSGVAIKLWVDDIRRAPKGWHCARTVTEAVRALATLEVEAVSLDHDITHTVIRGEMAFPIYDKDMRPIECHETFEPVAYYIAAKIAALKFEWQPRVRLHTANMTGATRMARILTGLGIEIEMRLADERDYEDAQQA